jgi:hypothetical protein
LVAGRVVLPLVWPPAAHEAGGAPAPESATTSPHRAARGWCVSADDDPVEPLDPAQRLALLNTLLPRQAGRVQTLGPLKRFALGLNAERTLIAADCIGDGYWFVDKVSTYAKERIVFDRPIAKNQGVQFPIAQAYM